MGPSEKRETLTLPKAHPTYDDDRTLERLGKRPRLTRSFGYMSMLGFSCSGLCSWESIMLSSVPSLLIGGPASVIWGILFNWIGMASIYFVLAELSSMAPTNGGQYHWVAMLAPPSWSSFLSYMTAWLTTLAWQAVAATVAYIVATLLQGIIILANPHYIPAPWHTVFLIWAVGLVVAMLNSMNNRYLAKLESLILILHLAGFFGIIIPMVYLAPHNDASFVFTTIFNNGGWPTQGIAFMISLPGMTAPLIGADCAVHMSEEIQSAAIIVPKAIVSTVFINGVLAFAAAIALLFCIEDIEAAVAAVETVFYPCLYVFQTVTNSITGACLMGGLIFILAVAGMVSLCATTSPMLWSFSRDNGLPFSIFIVKLTSNSIPVAAIYTTLGITMLLALISLGSAVALQALLSLMTGALLSSYILPCSLLLWRRCVGEIQPYYPDGLQTGLAWGPWKLPGLFGTINNIYACLYGVLIFFWSFWPTAVNPTAETFNWSILVYVVVILFSVVWWIVRARHYFEGPIKEV
ncbi:amino acid/polyamine transporter I [Stachybotrys elegans]|uniref:Amino acid/polyamine transporter I n=1 Tax=Stachybotrys elegans TaxID=80388 RepID=A0A8K0SCD1_9HYPO|nr:amino acid/polyamine transporter I [Stachybotrys elegans]